MSLANMRFVKPLDVELVRQLALSHDALVTIEENALEGGAGSACLEALAADRIERPVLQLGLPDRFVDHGDTAALLRECGLDTEGIVAAVRRRFPELARDARVMKSVA
jgi:1-deoxy-D-xylulose-5-phosphate synthase